MRLSPLLLSLALVALAPAQDVRPKDVRDIAKAGPAAIPKLQDLLKNPNVDVRVEAVKQITSIGTQRSLDPLIEATRDADAEVEIRATDGLVNFYLPGYVQTGIGASLKRVGTGIKGHFTDTNDQVIPPFVVVRPEVIAALGTLARGNGSVDVQANAARALGILRAKAAVDDLIQAAHSKSTEVIYESLTALQKIRDESAAPRITFLLHDLDPKVQAAAIETTGLLLNKSAVPELIGVMNHTRDAHVRRAALEAISMLPLESSRADLRAVFERQGREHARGSRGGLRAAKEPVGSTDYPDSLAEREQNLAAPFPGLRHGDAGEDRAERVQPPAISDQHVRFVLVQGHRFAVPGGIGTQRERAPFPL